MPDIIVLEVVYDGSDIMTDYWNPDAPIERWYVCEVQGKAVTEAKMRRALMKLPEWLQKLNWKYRKGEKYSMSDHPYGQLRVDEGTGMRFPCGGTMREGSSPVSYILDTTWEDIFKMNDKLENPIPPTPEAMKAFVEEVIRERERKQREAQQARERATQPWLVLGPRKEEIPGPTYVI